MRKAGIILTTATFAFALVGQAAAQDYPKDTIRIVVAAAAGGGLDPSARQLADAMKETAKVPVIIDNRPGANGTLAVAEVIRSAPDGYTLLFANDAPFTIVPILSKSVRYDRKRDLEDVSVLAEGGCNVLVVAADSPWTTLADFIAAAQKSPGQITYATPGVGSPAHISSEAFADATKVKLRAVHYKSAPEATPDVITGRVSAFFANTINAVPYISSGQLKPLAVTAAERCATLPDVATVAESGYPGFEAGRMWIGLFAPKGTPAEVIARVQDMVIQAKGAESVVNAFAMTSNTYAPLDPAASTLKIDADVAGMADRLTRLGFGAN